MFICSDRARDFRSSLFAEVDLSITVTLKYLKGDDQTCLCGRYLEVTVLFVEHTVVLHRCSRGSLVLKSLPGQLFVHKASPAVKLESYDKFWLMECG